MSDSLPKILWCGEASFLSTGFSTYSLEVLKRLHATGKYDLLEYGSYGAWGDERALDLPWKYVTPMPDRRDEKQVVEYESCTLNEFGAWKFEEVCLMHLQAICVDYRDWWSLAHEESSPFRPYYHWSIMPTCDAVPQNEQWISTYVNADAVFGYTDWAIEVLKEQSDGQINTVSSAPPGADFETLNIKPNKRLHKQSMGIDPDFFIVGTVMRNQRRKLYPDLLEAFAEFLRVAPKRLADKTFLYLHTGWPDVGWDLPALMKEFGVTHRCLFTYYCKACGGTFISYFSDAKTVCHHCNQPAAGFPTTQLGVSRSTLNDVMGVMDVYVQYASSEGQGMPQVEAAACGVPVMSVDYSGMYDVVRKLNGIPIKVQRFYREPETNCKRALPDNGDFITKLIDFLSLPEPIRVRRGYESRQLARQHFNYDKTAKIWEEHFDSISLSGPSPWLSPLRIHEPNLNVPAGLSDDEFVRWCILNVAGRPEMLNSYAALRMVQDLCWGVTKPQMGGLYFNESSTIGLKEQNQPFNRELAMREMLKLAHQKNYWEARRGETCKKLNNDV